MGMIRHRTPKIVGLGLIIFVVTGLVMAAYVLVPDGFGGSVGGYRVSLLGPLLILSCVSLAGLGFYHWRETTRLRREVTGLKRGVADLQRTEEVLHVKEAPYREVLDSLPIVLIALDTDGVFTLVEGKGLDALGLEPKEVIGRSIFETYRNAPRITEDVRLALAGKSFDSTVEVNGLTFEMRYSPLQVDGRFAGALGIVTDITERTEARRALGENQRRLATLLSGAPAYLYRCRNEPEWPNEFVSDHAQELTGYTPRELTDGTVMFGDLILEEDRDNVWEEVQAALAEHRRFELQYALRHKDGEVRHVEERGQGVYDDGRVEAIEGVVYDVTERVRGEELLREAEERFRRSFEDAAIGMALVAIDGRSMQVNDALCRILGYPKEELVEKTVQEVTHPDDLEADLDHVRRMIAGEILTYQMEKRYFHKEGHVVWALLSVSLVRADGGDPLYVVSQIQDISDRKAAARALEEAEERYRTLVEQIPAVTYIDKVTDGPDEIIYTSPQIKQLLGYTPEEWRTKELWPERLHPNDRERILAADKRFEAGDGEPFSEEYRLLAKDGSVVWVREEAVLVKDAAQRPLYWQGVILDITDRKEAEESLRQSEERYRTVVKQAAEGIFIVDIDTKLILEANAAYRNLLGYSAQDMLGLGLTLYDVVARDRETIDRYVEKTLENGTLFIGERRHRRKDGSIVDVEVSSSVISYGKGEALCVIVHDITERKRLEVKLQRQALHDPLTELPNRTLFADRLRQALTRVKRRGSRVAVLFMDLDNFKVINDSLGHKAGDRLLVAASKRMRALLRPEDTVARLGGDEFVFLLEGTSASHAIRIAERLLQQFRKPFTLSSRKLVITASIGIVMSDTVATESVNGRNAADLLRKADMAMYRAKQSGKARYAVFKEAMNTIAIERLEMEHGLRRALEKGELRIHYQPQMLLDADLQRSLRSKGSGAIVSTKAPREPQIVGTEALVRWEHPERGLLLPGEFVPLAEETGLIVPIGKAMLEQACRQIREWQESSATDTPLSVSVNLSGRQLREPDLAQSVSRVLKETGLDPACLHLEITESTAMGNAPSTISALEDLKALGVRLVIDDFGTGYSSLSYLGRFPVDRLKIDRTFVGGLETEAGAAALVSGMIGLAHALGIEVIAEGVERAGQLERLRTMECNLVQGRFFSEPLPPDAMEELLNGWALA
jgi:diguanylate cyclase (GGDEF)-like protein/PAS domain S-box-containing protein